MLAQLRYMFLILYAVIYHNLHISLVITNLLYKIKQKNKMHFFFKRINAFYKSPYSFSVSGLAFLVFHIVCFILKKRTVKKEFLFLQSFFLA